MLNLVSAHQMSAIYIPDAEGCRDGQSGQSREDRLHDFLLGDEGKHLLFCTAILVGSRATKKPSERWRSKGPIAFIHRLRKNGVEFRRPSQQ
jgi:hypothetical protein